MELSMNHPFQKDHDPSKLEMFDSMLIVWVLYSFFFTSQLYGDYKPFQWSLFKEPV